MRTAPCSHHAWHGGRARACHMHASPSPRRRGTLQCIYIQYINSPVGVGFGSAAVGAGSMSSAFLYWFWAGCTSLLATACGGATTPSLPAEHNNKWSTAMDRTLTVPCTYGPALPLHSISSCNGECQTFYTLEQAEEACSADRKCRGICAEQRPTNASCSYVTFSPRVGKLQSTPATGPFHNQTSWLINNSVACGHGPPLTPPAPSPPSPSPPHPPPPPPPPQILKQMPYPLPRNITASGPPVQLAQAVSVVMAPTPSPGLDPAVPCGNGTVCRAIFNRYQTLLAVKTSGNFIAGNESAVINRITVVITPSSVEDAVAQTPLPDTPEDYILQVNGTSVVLEASSIFGARAGLESFAQMVSNRPSSGGGSSSTEGGQAGPGGWLEHSQVFISDSPVYAYR
jgi:hypothetical protein